MGEKEKQAGITASDEGALEDAGTPWNLERVLFRGNLGGLGMPHALLALALRAALPADPVFLGFPREGQASGARGGASKFIPDPHAVGVFVQTRK